MKLVFATRNRGKLRELRQLVSVEGLELVCLDDFPKASEIEESGTTFAENARIKAIGTMRALGFPCLADDSGLEVDALGKAPGVHSARYAGPSATDDDRIALLLKNLHGVPEPKRTARFRCAVAFVDPISPDEVVVCEGACEGRILPAPRGHGGFGYDPVFFIDDLGLTFAEIPAEEKNRRSHRGQAMRKIAEHLRRHFAPQGSSEEPGA